VNQDRAGRAARRCPWRSGSRAGRDVGRASSAARIRPQQTVDLLAERIQLRRPRPPPIPWRLSRTQRPPDRVTAVTGAPDDLLDRQPLHEIQAADLRPLLHPDHNLLLARTCTTERGSRPPGQRQRRRRGVSYRPASGGQYSGGADKPVPLVAPVREVTCSCNGCFCA
jgi:hypothetical protein